MSKSRRVGEIVFLSGLYIAFATAFTAFSLNLVIVNAPPFSDPLPRALGSFLTACDVGYSVYVLGAAIKALAGRAEGEYLARLVAIGVVGLTLINLFPLFTFSNYWMD